MPPGEQDKDELIATLEKEAPLTNRYAVLWGFWGETVDHPDKGRVQRLYLDLTRERWLEISVADIDASHPLEPGRGSLAWVQADLGISEVRESRARDWDVGYGFLSGGFWQQTSWDEEIGGTPPATTRKWVC